MSSATRKERRARRRWITRRRVVLGFLLVAVGAVAWPNAWLPFAIERFGPSLTRRFAGLELRVEDVEAAGWSRFAARGVLLRAPGDDPWLDVNLPWVDARYRATRFLDDPIGAVQALELTRPRVLIDVSGSSDAEPDAGGGGVARMPRLPERLPELSVLDGVFELVGVTPDPIAVTGLALETEDRRRVSLRFRELRGGGYTGDEPLRQGAIEADYDGGDWDAVSLVVDGEAIVRGGYAEIAELSAGAARFGVNLEARGARASATARLVDGAWSGELDVEAFALPWIAGFLPAELDPAGYVDMDGSWSLPNGDLADATGTARVTGRDMSLHGAPLIALDGEVRLADGRLVSDALSIEQSRNRLRIDDAFWRVGGVSMADFGFHLEAEARDVPALAALAGVPAPEEPPPAHDLRLSARVADGVLLVERGTLDTVGGRMTIRAGVVPPDPTPDAPRRVELEADFDDLSELGRLVSAGSWSGSLAGDITYLDRGEGPELRCVLVGERVTVEDHELGDLRLSAGVTPPVVVVSDLSSEGPAGRIEGVGTWDWEDRRLAAVRLSVDVHALDRLVPSAGIVGSAKGAVSLDGPLDALDGSVSLTSEGLEVAGYSLVSARVAAAVRGGDLRLDELELIERAASLQLAGDLGFDAERELRSVQLERLRVSVDDADLELQRPAELRREDDGTTIVEDLHLLGSAGRLDLTLDWGPARRVVEMSTRDLRVDRLLRGREFGEFALDGLDGDVSFAVEDGRAAGSADLRVRGVRSPGTGPPVDVELRANQADGRLTVQRLGLANQDGVLVEGYADVALAPLADEWLPDEELTLELRSGPALAAHLGVVLGYPTSSGALNVDLELSGTTGAPRGSLRLGLDELNWIPDADRPAVGPADVDVELQLSDRRLAVTRGEASLDGAEAVRLVGELRGPTDPRAWIADARTAAEDTELDLSLATRAFDWQRVAVQLTRLGVDPGPVRTGVFDADLSIDGFAVDPRLHGSASLTDGSARLGTLPSIAEVSADLLFEGRRLELVGFRGELGGADFELSGTIEFADAGLVLDARLVGDDLLLVRHGGTRVRANVDATVSGPLEELLIAGRAEVADGVYSTRIDVTSFLGGPKPVRARGLQIFRISEGPMANARFDLEVGTAPGAAFRIETSTYVGGLRPDLHLSGTGELPILIGVVYFDPAIVNLPATRLHVTSGTLVFDEANPFVPELSVQCEGRIRGYDVSVQVAGPFDATEVTMSSDPSLNTTELLNLVLTGRVPGDENTRAGDVAQQLATYLAKDFLSWWIAPEPGDTSSDSLMDRIEIITGEDVSQTGASTIEGRFRLAEHVTRENDTLYVIAERDEYDFYNVGIRISFRVR